MTARTVSVLMRRLSSICLPNGLIRQVAYEEASSLQLDDVALFQVLQAGIPQHQFLVLQRKHKTKTHVLKTRALNSPLTCNSFSGSWKVLLNKHVKNLTT